MGVAGADTDEAAVEMLALSARDRVLVAETVQRLGYLRPGDDVTHACDIVDETLRRGDACGYWLANGHLPEHPSRWSWSAA